ncbi:MAG TPA: hypothetical protein ENF41_04195 [Candidatus Bathyarchaeota archaeon]|nr:hypothetical protein [Candidatus Bathyarchaeota archaeon]
MPPEHKIYVTYREGARDPQGLLKYREMMDLGVSSISEVKSASTYRIRNITMDALKKLCKELLVDPILQKYAIDIPPFRGGGWLVEVWLKPGVADPVSETIKDAARFLDLSPTFTVSSGMTYFLVGELTENTLKWVIRKSLANPIIHTYEYRWLE